MKVGGTDCVLKSVTKTEIICRIEEPENLNEIDYDLTRKAGPILVGKHCFGHELYHSQRLVENLKLKYIYGISYTVYACFLS